MRASRGGTCLSSACAARPIPKSREFPHEWISLGEAGKLFRLLRSHDCGDVLFAGRVARPKLAELKTDAKGILLLPRIISAARAGDDALLRALADIIAGEGFRSVGLAEAAPELLAPEGVLGRLKPAAVDQTDIALGVKVVRRLGALDVGQSAIVCAGLVLAVEAAEGTDAMILRVRELPENIRGRADEIARRPGQGAEAHAGRQDRSAGHRRADRRVTRTQSISRGSPSKPAAL